MIKSPLIKYMFYLYKYLIFLFKKSNIQSTLLYIIFVIYIYNKYISKYLNKFKTLLHRRIKNLEYVKNEKNKIVEQIKNDFFKKNPNEKLIYTLPDTGYTKQKLMEQLDTYKNLTNKPVLDNKISGTVYTCDNELSQVILQSFKKFQFTNPLHSDLFPGLQRMESSIVNICLDLYKGNENSIGNVTSGGTESILMSCKAHRDFGKDNYDITDPEIIICKSAHVAFNKAAHYLGVKLVILDEDPLTREFDVKYLENALNENTILVVASAPSFPHGVIDPIKKIGDIIKSFNFKNNKKIGIHLDACLGGFILPFKEIIERQDLGCNFSNENITSISIDTHKYGYSPKGSSIIMYRDKSLAHYQYHVEPNWPGGIYISPNMAGSRSGAIIAGTWAAIMYHGHSGYLDKTKKILEIVNYIYKELQKIGDIEILAKPDTTVISIGSKKINIYLIGELMSKRGWSLNMLQFPPSMHICVTGVHTKQLGKTFIEDIKSSIKDINEGNIGEASGMFGIYGTSQTIPDRSVVKEIGYEYLDAYYS